MNTNHLTLLALALALCEFSSAQNAPDAPVPATTDNSEKAPVPPEMTPELRHDIERLIAMRANKVIHNVTSSLGNAFVRERFLAAYREAILAGKECAEPGKEACPLACHIANEVFQNFDPGDFDPPGILDELDRQLAAKAIDDKAVEKHSEAVWKKYRPIRLSREEAKERNLLRMNAARPEVTTLGNGIQYEIEPGNDSIRDINRCTRETGISFYTRTTSEIDFDRLPESIRQIADELPAASSWTFYVPYEAEKAVRDSRQQEEKDLDARRLERLQKLLPERVKEYKPAEETRRETSERQPLLRIKVWKDDPKAPVQVKPDVFMGL